MQDSYGQDQGTVQLIIDQLEELIVTVIEEIRERPGVAAALLAAVVGIVIGSVLAGVGRQRTSAPKKIAKRARGMADAGDLIGIGMKLLQNPIVRGYIFAALAKQLKRRTG